MAKIIQFSPTPGPEKFGPQRARRKKDAPPPPATPGKAQLNLFAGAKVLRLNQLSVFEEALLVDDQGDKKSARVNYLKAIQEGDSIADAYCNLGILEWQDNNASKAIDYFTQSLKNDPRHYESHYNLANLYAEVGNYALAKIHYQIAIEIEPDFANSYFNLGLTLAMNKEFQEAVKVLKRYRQMTPGEDHAHTDDLIFKLATTL